MPRKKLTPRLQRMLRDIQRIKAEKPGLVTARDAYNAIKDEHGIYTGPVKITIDINSDVRKRFDNPTYLATPARITGIDTWSLLGPAGGSELEHLSELGGNFFDIYRVACYSDEKEQQEIDKNYFLPIFLEANSEQISEDHEISSILMQSAQKDYDKIKNKISDDKRPEFDRLVRDLCLDFSSHNWYNTLSEEEHMIRQDSKLTEHFCDQYNQQDMVRRIKTDQVEHRLEYTRGLLDFVLYGHLKGRLSSLFSMLLGTDQKSWNSLVREYDTKIYNIKESLEKSTDENEIKDRTESLENLIFIRRIIGRDKNWIEKELRKRNEDDESLDSFDL